MHKIKKRGKKKKLKCPQKHDLPILLLRPLGECYRVGYVYSCRRTFEAETLTRSQNWCRVLTPGELSFDRWHKLKKPLVKDKPTFTRFQDPQERQKLKQDGKKLSNLGASFLMLPVK